MNCPWPQLDTQKQPSQATSDLSQSDKSQTLETLARTHSRVSNASRGKPTGRDGSCT
jgi:hypothetical protein